MDLTRRRLLITAAGLAAAATGVVGLSGCNASADSTPAAGAPSAAAGAAEEGAFPVTLTHRFGETTIASEPKRIVCVGLKEQDDLLAVGVVPVGASPWLDFSDGNKILGPWTEDALGSAPVPETLDNTNGIRSKPSPRSSPISSWRSTRDRPRRTTPSSKPSPRQ